MSINIETFLNHTMTTINMTAHGNITPASSVVNITNTGGTHYLEGINNGVTGQVIHLIAGNKFIVDESDNLKLKKQTGLIPQNQAITFLYNGASWIEISRTQDTEVLEWGGSLNVTDGTIYPEYNSYGSMTNINDRAYGLAKRAGHLSRFTYSLGTTNPSGGTLRLLLNDAVSLQITAANLISGGSVVNGFLCGAVDLDEAVAEFDKMHIEVVDGSFGAVRVCAFIS